MTKKACPECGAALDSHVVRKSVLEYEWGWHCDECGWGQDRHWLAWWMDGQLAQRSSLGVGSWRVSFVSASGSLVQWAVSGA